MSKLNCICKLIVSFALLVGWTLGNIHADESRNDAKIRITGDTVVAEFTDDNGSLTIEGKVRLEQTNVTLTADRMKVLRQNGEVNEVVAIGQPVAFKQTLPNVVVATANQISYELGSRKLLLIGSVELQQNGNELHGERIEYDLEKDELVAGSSDSDETTQVEFVLEEFD